MQVSAGYSSGGTEKLSNRQIIMQSVSLVYVASKSNREKLVHLLWRRYILELHY